METIVIANGQTVREMTKCRLTGSGNVIDYAEDSFIDGNDNTVGSGHRLVFIGERNTVQFGCVITGASVILRCDGSCCRSNASSARRGQAPPASSASARFDSKPAAVSRSRLPSHVPSSQCASSTSNATNFIRHMLDSALQDIENHVSVSVRPQDTSRRVINSSSSTSQIALPAAAVTETRSRPYRELGSVPRQERRWLTKLKLDRPVPAWALSAFCDMCTNKGPLFIYAPCGHNNVCQECTIKWAKNCTTESFTCPICRTEIDGVAFMMKSGSS